MLLLCITGLPLIFHHEIDELLHEEVPAAIVPAGTPKADLDVVVANALKANPGKVPHFLIWDRDEPNTMWVSIGPSIEVNPQNNRLARVDAHTGAYLDSPAFEGRFTYIMLRLHTDMFAGLPGKLFLGLMGILFCVAIISGIVVYAPAMRKLRFGAYRRGRPRVVRWLDFHNLTGITLVMWMLVVGFTGTINTWADLAIKMWQFDQLADMTAQYKDRPLVTTPVSIEGVARVSRETEPDMVPAFIAYPGSLFSSKTHYAVFMRGDTPLTSRLLKPILVDAATGQVTDSRSMAWYVSTVLLSQPLHFGDYGGLPLRIIWAILDVITIAILITGLYLWLRRRQSVSAVSRMIRTDRVHDRPAVPA